MRSTLLLLSLATLTLALSSAAADTSAEVDTFSPGTPCRDIRGEINLTTGTITGNFGLDGTVAFVGDGPGTAPPNAPPVTSVFSGILTITTNHGNLVLRETGLSTNRAGNPAGGLLTAFGETLDGTQLYDGVAGELFFAGRRVGTSFLVKVLGELCYVK